MNVIEEIENFDRALRVADLAMLLSFSEPAIYKFVAENTLRCYRIGSSIRFDPKVTADRLRERLS
jgi:excisionase family DNA binding protein